MWEEVVAARAWQGEGERSSLAQEHEKNEATERQS